MATATAQRAESVPQIKLQVDGVQAFESAVQVDEEAGVIRGVKIQGFESSNTGRVIGLPSDKPYSYDREAIARSISLYEGAPCFINHPRFNYESSGERKVASMERDFDDRFGKFVNCRVTESGVYGDLMYLKEHPRAKRVLEAAARMPEAFACSPVTISTPFKKGDRYVLRIDAIKSVDLVASKPGTTVSLFESEAPPIEDNTMDAEKLTALESEVAKQQEKLLALESENAQLKADAEKAKRHEAARAVCESAGLPLTAPLLNAMSLLATDEERKALADEWPKVGGRAVVTKSQEQRTTTETTTEKTKGITLESSLDDVAALLTV